MACKGYFGLEIAGHSACEIYGKVWPAVWQHVSLQETGEFRYEQFLDLGVVTVVFYEGDYGCKEAVGLRLAVDVVYDVCGFQMVVPLNALPELLQVSLEHL